MSKYIIVAISIWFIGCSNNNSSTDAGDSLIDPPSHNEHLIRPICEKKQSLVREDLQAASAAQTFEEFVSPLIRDQFVTPTEKVGAFSWPQIDDDLDFDNFELAINRQLRKFSQGLPGGTIRLGTDEYPLNFAVKSLERIKELVVEFGQCAVKSGRASCLRTFSRTLKSEFNMYRPKLTSTDPRFGEDKTAFFTGYYTPLIHASAQKSLKYSHAIYGLPGDNNSRRATRTQIDFDGALENQALELHYTADLFDLYMAHIQGNAKIEFDDDKRPGIYLNYDGTNGQRFQFISTYMMKNGLIDNDSIEAQRSFLNENPGRQKEVYANCPSYVYFRPVSHPPTGNSGVSVTGNRSIATDTRYYAFKGLVSFIVSERPDPDQSSEKSCDTVKFKSFSRFFIDQDTGGAIRGKARADIFFGEGEYAEFAASNQAEKGNIYFLMLKR